MGAATKYVLVMVFFCCKIDLAFTLKNNYCNGIANLIKIDEWSPLMNYEALLNTTKAYPQIVTEENFLHSSIEVLTVEIENWRNASPSLELPGGTHLANSGLYKIMHSKPGDAESNCTKSNGILPRIEFDEDEHVGLGELLARKNLNQTVIRAFPERSGYYTGTGFLIGEYSATPLPGYRYLNETEDINGDMNDIIGDPRGPMIARLGPNRTAVLSSIEEEDRDVAIDFLCRVPGISCYRTKAERDACIYQGTKLLEYLHEYHAYVKSIRISLTASRSKDGNSDIQLAMPPTNSTVLQVETIETGVSTFRYLLAKLSAAAFYHDTRLDFATVLLDMKLVVAAAFDEYTLEEGEQMFAIELTSEAIPHLNSRSRVTRDVTTTLVKWAGAYVLEPFRDYIILAAIKILERVSPTTLFAIRSFLNNDHMILKDRFLLDDGQRAYTTFDRPEVVGCNMIQGVKACESYGIETDGVLDYDCGERLAGRRGNGKCSMTYPKDRYEVFPRVACPLQSANHQGLLNDVIISDRDGKVIRDCGKRGSSEFVLREGTNAFDATKSLGCDFKIDNHIVFHSPDYSSGNIPNLSPESTLSQGKSPAVSDRKYETPLGDFETWQIVVLSAIILSLSATATLGIAIACNPRWRLEFLRNWCCCFLPHGWRNWLNNSMFSRWFCNCRVVQANSWDSIPCDDQDPNFIELQDVNPPAIIDEGPIGLACASNASNALPNVGPRVSFDDVQPLVLSDMRRALNYLSSDEGASAASQYENKREVARILNDMYQELMPKNIPDDRCREDRCLNDVAAIEMDPNPTNRQSRSRASTARASQHMHNDPAQMSRSPQRPRRRTRSQPPPSYEEGLERPRVQRVDPKTGARSKR